MARNRGGRPADARAAAEFYEDAPAQESMRGGNTQPRNPSTDQKAVRRRHRTAAEEESRMSAPTSQSNEVTRLLMEAAKAPTLAASSALVAQAEELRSAGFAATAAAASWDAGNTEVRDTLTPVRVHEHHTAATDWIGSEPDAVASNARQLMLASATSWYSGLHPFVASDSREFRIQAEGVADRECGAFGHEAESARQSFLTMAATLRARDLHAGRIVEATVTGETGQVGMGAADVLGQNPPTGTGYQGLPGQATDSNRAPAFQDMTAPSDTSASGPDGSSDAGVGGGMGQTPSSNPQKAASTTHGGQMPFTASDTRENYEKAKADRERKDTNNGKRPPTPPTKGPNRDKSKDSKKPDWLEEKIEDDDNDSKKEGSMQRSAIGQHVATCPSCAGFGGVATTEQGRAFIASLQRQGYSGLHQIDEIADPKDDPSETPYPTDVAFPMEQGGWNPQNGPQQDIAQAEQQISQRNQLIGNPGSVTKNSGLTTEQLARQAAQQAYNAVHAARRPRTVWDLFSTAGQDDSGWLGDMGAGGVAPGQQDVPPPPGSNLGMPDPVYGQGGDQPPGQRRPFGNDETSDRTNQPDNWQPGQPTQMDQAARGQQLPPSGAPAYPDNGGGYGNAGGNQFQNQKSSSFDNDPEVRRAQQFIAHKAQQYGVR